MKWTPEKPTKPGRYELSIAPGKRGDHPVVMHAKINERGDVYAGLLVLPWLLDGAMWREYVEPADPFRTATRVRSASRLSRRAH
jgi:hypothetical protein